MNDAVLRLTDVTFGYGQDGPVLDRFSIRVDAGERVGIVGPNGCGKTTLLRLIVGLERPQGGTVEVLAKPRATEADFAEARREVGLVFQDSDDQLFCPTVHEDVAFGPFNLGLSHAEVHEVVRETLAMLNLEHLEDRVTYRLSEGQKRLVALATVLAMKPRVLLLDEPTTGLDEKHERILQEVLLGLPQEMLIVSHNEAFLERVATRTLRLDAPN